MNRARLSAALAIFLSASVSAFAGEVVVSVADQDGAPAKDVVVALSAELAPANSVNAAPKIIDQSDEQFVPLVTVVGVGGGVAFTNSDLTRHHVYSFSAIKQFEFVLDPGQKSDPVVFDTAGVAAIGCNIHDRMVAYVFVASTPYAAVTGADGRVSFADLPDGTYTVALWHPFQKGQGAPAQRFTISGGSASAALTIPLVPVWERAITHPHEY